MKERTGRVVAVLAAAVVIALIGTLQVAQSQGGGAETFRLTSIDNKEKTESVDADGDGEESVGDFEVGSGPLFKKGRRAGYQNHECFNIKGTRNKFVARCGGTFKVQGRGSIEVSGTLKFVRRGGIKSGILIVGGTGEFSGARGTMDFSGRRGRTIFIFHVR
jgi:hypothetical protein